MKWQSGSMLGTENTPHLTSVSVSMLHYKVPENDNNKRKKLGELQTVYLCISIF